MAVVLAAQLESYGTHVLCGQEDPGPQPAASQEPGEPPPAMATSRVAEAASDRREYAACTHSLVYLSWTNERWCLKTVSIGAST